MYNTTGKFHFHFERVNIKKKGTKGKIETLSLRVNKLGSLISKDFCNYSYLFIVRVCVCSCGHELDMHMSEDNL